MRRIRAQSTLEYVIVLTAIIAAVLAGVIILAPANKTQGVGKLIDKTTDIMKTKTGQLPGAN